LFNLDLHEVGNLLSRQDLRDSVFQDSILIVLCLGNCLIVLIKENFKSDENIEVQDRLIPSKLEEETNFLDSDIMSILKPHYVTYYM
jgi:hypothetical protein